MIAVRILACAFAALALVFCAAWALAGGMHALGLV
jgi:hypothetical protein